MISTTSQQSVYSILRKLRGLEQLKKLFWSELNYDHVNQLLPGYGVYRSQMKYLAEDPVLFAVGGTEGDFHIIYIRMQASHLESNQERPVALRLLQDHPYSLFVFSNYEQNQWHFLNVKYDINSHKRRLLRRITVSSDEQLRTASQRLSLLDQEIIGQKQDELTALAIQQRHDEAFDVEAVTKLFFDEYKSQFYQLQTDLYRQTEDPAWAHDYALQFLNRCMFLYFVQRKRWLGGDSEFLYSFWHSYKGSDQPRDSFTDRWLKVLFFEAFNNKFCDNHDHFPQSIRKTLGAVPYLNGGLFAENALDRKYPHTISDHSFQQIFDFLAHYNFTITEDSPLDQEVAVDPEMIGKVYESLVNVSGEVDERGNAGIFYTPRTEIDLMCRLALVDNLSNSIGQDHKNRLYEAVFALEPDEKVAADEALATAGLWPTVFDHLCEITVVDPSCGSGAFLVGMLYILDDLQSRAAAHRGITESPYERKKRIIGQNLYGVDVMEWAIHIAELRLWLALIIDAPMDLVGIDAQYEPLLPYFTFKLRCGDSIVGDLNLTGLRSVYNIPPELKARLTSLKNEKLKFYNNDPGCLFPLDNDLRREEVQIFCDLVFHQKQAIQNQINTLRRNIDGPLEQQLRLDGTFEAQPGQTRPHVAGWQKQLEELLNEYGHLESTLSELRSSRNIPFVWDIAFVEIFESEKHGFDIVIGNPPYVRQENIADPHLPPTKVSTDNKKSYKAKLSLSIYQAFPRFFGYSSTTGSATRKVDAKSDLYIYFYFHSLSLLNRTGALCFITSNSWLDVSYGTDLQEFLLKHCHIKLVLDNMSKRSFASADVNTAILLCSAPHKTDEPKIDTLTRFVMFKIPYEHIVSSVIFEEIEEITGRKATPEYRVHATNQSELLAEGQSLSAEVIDDLPPQWQQAEPSSSTFMKFTKYLGNKWGGKYLRAPDIYWTVIRKGQGKLRRLGDVAEVRFGIKSGANEFFYLDEERIRACGIEEEFLRPVIKSPRECKRIQITPHELKFRIFMCHLERDDLKGTAALEYINWGERQGFHLRPSCSGRARWWDLSERRIPPIISPSSVSDLARTFRNDGVLADKRMYEIYPHGSENAILLATNSTLSSMFLEIGSRTGLGEGLLDLTVYELADCPIMLPQASRLLEEAIIRASKRPSLSWKEELQHSTRRAMDGIIFDALGLTQGERDAVYEAVSDLVGTRLKKAKSLEPGQ